MTDHIVCANCKFWCPDGLDPGETAQEAHATGEWEGSCRRYPPVLDVPYALRRLERNVNSNGLESEESLSWCRPKTHSDTFCGEWQKEMRL